MRRCRAPAWAGPTRRVNSVGRAGSARPRQAPKTLLFRIQAESGSMGDINRVALFGKLNSLAYKSIEGATVFCKLRGNPYVELVHWLHQVLQQPNSDLA